MPGPPTRKALGGTIGSAPAGAVDGAEALRASKLGDELLLDGVQLALDLAGVVDPTPASDGASLLISLMRGDMLGAGIGVVSMVPYIGDLAKAGKLPRYLRSVEKIIELAETNKEFAKKAIPLLRRLDELLDLLPKGVNATVSEMKHRVRSFLDKAPGVRTAKKPVDISKTFTFKQTEVASHAHGTVIEKVAKGRLGVPGSVRTHAGSNAAVSRHSGDDASHLIGAQFGAPKGKASGNTGKDNLSLGNFKMNQGGIWRKQEEEWAAKLKNGIGIEVEIVDTFKKSGPLRGTNEILRPMSRKYSWVEIYPDGTTKRFSNNLVLGNFESTKSVKGVGYQGKPFAAGHSAEVVPLDAYRKPKP